MNRLTSVIVGASLMVGGLFAVLATATTAPATTPYCPEEDSCSPSYDGWSNTWTITEDR